VKNLLRHYLIDLVALYFVSTFASGMVFAKGAETLLLAAAGLTVFSILAKPVINLLLLPLNLITFGLFRWASSVVALYLVTLVVPGFAINNFAFSGFTTNLIIFPPLNLQGVLAIIAYSFIISVFTSLIHWLIK